MDGTETEYDSRETFGLDVIHEKSAKKYKTCHFMFSV